MHNPERWPVLQLGGTEARDPTWPARHAAAALYNAEHKAKKAPCPRLAFSPLLS